MHLEEADRLLPGLVAALRPGGVVLFEEADSYPVAAATSAAFSRVLGPIVARWTWARGLPGALTGLPVTDIGVEVDAELLRGGSPTAAFWSATLETARGPGGPVRARSVPEGDLDEVFALLADPGFWTPFMAVICVWARRTAR